MDFEALSEKLAEENQRLRREVEFLRNLMDSFVKEYSEQQSAVVEEQPAVRK